MKKTVLPDAPWRHSAGLHAVVAALNDANSPVRIVGGAVRDSLLGMPVADVDLATPIIPENVIRRLSAANIKAFPTGIDHGTITAVSDGQNIEITTLRRDVSTDGRRATVAFSTDWHEDAARRDFTINALYANPVTGEIFDYFGGLDDLDVGIVRFIGNADSRIAEDHLRILRFFRFHARFGKGEPDLAAITACAKAKTSLMALSRERIADELSKLLVLPNPLSSVSLMIRHGIFSAFIPEISDNAESSLSALLKREETVSAKPEFSRRLSAILPFDDAIVEKISVRLKMSNRLRQKLVQRASAGFLDSIDPSLQARRLAYRHGIIVARDCVLLHAPDAQFQVAYGALDGWKVPVFQVKGGQLIARGLKAGPSVAACLKSIEEQWIAEDFPNQNRTLEIVDHCVDAMLSIMKE